MSMAASPPANSDESVIFAAVAHAQHPACARTAISLDRHGSIRYLSIPFPVNPVDDSEALDQSK